MSEIQLSEPIPPGALVEYNGVRAEVQGISVKTGNPVFLQENDLVSHERGVPFEMARSQLAALAEHQAFKRIGPFNERYRFGEYVREKFAWQNTFGPEIEVPHPPQLLVDTLARAKEIGISSFAAHYIPEGRLHQDKIELQGKLHDYPAGWHAVHPDFFRGHLHYFWSDSTGYLPGAWLLGDTTIRPDNSTIPDGMYPNDEFRPFLTDIDPLISSSLKLRQTGSRTRLSLDEIETIVLPELKSLLHLDRSDRAPLVRFSVPTIAITNICGNMFLPEWKAREKLPEWCGDWPRKDDGMRLATGFHADMTDVWNSSFTTPSQARQDLGFRTAIVFRREK